MLTKASFYPVQPSDSHIETALILVNIQWKIIIIKLNTLFWDLVKADCIHTQMLSQLLPWSSNL